MLRTITAIVAGGAVSLLILATTGSDKFIPLGIIFVIAAQVLIAAGVISGSLRRAREVRSRITAGLTEGRARTALILSRRQTGMYVNENPQVEFTLLVENPPSQPFLTTAREIVPMIDVHKFNDGAYLQVVHPDPEFGNVHINVSGSPSPSSWLTPQAAQTAQALPMRPKTQLSKSPGKVRLVVGAFLVGLVGAPFLVTPNPQEYVKLLLQGRTDEVALVDHANLFDAAELRQSFASLTAEYGHDEVFSVMVGEVKLWADIAVSAGSADAEEVTIQDHQVMDRQPANSAFIDDRFHLADVDWDAVLANVPAAAQVATQKGINDPKLERIHVTSDATKPVPIAVDLTFRGTDDTQIVAVDAQGAVKPAEQFKLLPQAEQDVYLLSIEHLQAAFAELSEYIELDQILKLTHHGDRFTVEVYVARADGTGEIVAADYRYGSVYGISSKPVAQLPQEGAYQLDDVDWEAILSAVPSAEAEITAAGAPGSKLTHFYVQPSRIPMADTYELTARLYLSNELNQGSSVVLNPDGSLNRVFEP